MTNPSATRRARATAPTRVDLAGGTLDIWPLYLLIDGAVTVNVAIDLRARAEVRVRSGAGDVAEALDLGIRAEIGERAPTSGDALPLHAAILRAAGRGVGLEVVTEAAVPAGSGLGGSSALAVALLAAVHAIRGERPAPAALVEIARDVEARVIGVPTGTQDHIAATYGGVSVIEWGPGSPGRRALPLVPEALEACGVLAYLGASRASARANWDMLRRALDEDPTTRRGLSAIADVARRMAAALGRGDLVAAARLLGDEWEARRGLSPEVSTESTEAALAAARQAGAIGGKICGAGGGGCLFVMGEPGARERIAAALESRGCRRLPFRIDLRGLEVEASPGAPD